MTGQNIHSIKLKGPWSILRRPGEETVTDGSAADTVHLPAEWQTLFGPVAGTAVFERRFNRPTGLSAGHRVRIVLRDVNGLQHVALNDAPLSVETGAAGPPFVEITQAKKIDIKLDQKHLYELDGGERDKVKKLKVRAKSKAIRVMVPVED